MTELVIGTADIAYRMRFGIPTVGSVPQRERLLQYSSALAGSPDMSHVSALLLSVFLQGRVTVLALLLLS